MLINMVLLMSHGDKTADEALQILRERAGLRRPSIAHRVKAKFNELAERFRQRFGQ